MPCEISAVYLNIRSSACVNALPVKLLAGEKKWLVTPCVSEELAVTAGRLAVIRGEIFFLEAWMRA